MPEVCAFEDMMKHFDYNTELLSTVYKKFKENSQDLIKQLENSIQKEDHESVSLIAHTLKGSSSNFYALELTGILQELERNVSNLSLQQQVEYLAQAKSSYNELILFLDQKLQ